MRRKPPFKLVLLRSRRISHDTVTCLRSLLTRAEAGEIIGFTAAVMEENREYFLSACGEAHRNPGFAGQMAGALWFGMMKRVFEEET